MIISLKMWIAEILFSIAVIATGIVFFVIAGTFRPSFNEADVGAAAFPRLIAVAMCIFALAQIAMSIKNREKSNNNIALGNKTTLLSGGALMFAYIWLMPILGFYIVTPIFSFGFMVLQGYRKWITMVLVSGGFCLFAYLLFTTFLRIQLP